MTYLTITPPARALADMVAAEMATVRRALGCDWTTPEALERGEQAADRLRGQMAALRMEMKRMGRDAR